ncbi:MAG: DUF1570 domain-containing protein [Gemmataceae bacterium]|nr:DUF1570 domain-containing protein [Gemmataceae bacterium]
MQVPPSPVATTKTRGGEGVSPSRILSGLLILALAGFAAAQPPAGTPAPWPLDEVTLHTGATYKGLLLSDTPTEVVIRTVRRPPGKPTFTLTATFDRRDIKAVKPLPDADRATLKQYLADLDPDGSGDRRRMEAVAFAPADWLGKPGAARRYDGEYFTLVSDAPEDAARRAVVRLEQLYTALARFFPPVVDARPTVIHLAADRDGYAALLAPLGRPDLLNPAVYDPKANRIACGSDLRRLGDDLQAAKLHHSQQLASLGRYEEGVRKLYRKAELDRHLDHVRAERKKVYAADRANMAAFDAAAGRLFAVLTHEAAHAYAAAFAYPPLPADEVRAGRGTGGLPRWLDEGLAQAFETALVEAGEVRADHPDPARLRRVQALLKGTDPAGGMVPLADLLTAGPDAFLSRHAGETAAADRAYLGCWALAHHLTFGRRVVGTTGFADYLRAVNAGADRRAAFEELVGQGLADFERDWHAALLKLPPDGPK